MIKKDEKGKLEVSLLEIQRPLPVNIIEEYNHKNAIKEIHNIFNQLMDNYFYQVAYQEFLKYTINEDLEFIIVEDPTLHVKTVNSNNVVLKNDISFKRFTKHDYRKSIDLCEMLLKRVKDAFDNLDEFERFIIKNFEYDNPREYVDESLYYEMHIHKDKYYVSKKSAYIKMAIQLGLMVDTQIESLIINELKRQIGKNIITIGK